MQNSVFLTANLNIDNTSSITVVGGGFSVNANNITIDGPITTDGCIGLTYTNSASTGGVTYSPAQSAQFIAQLQQNGLFGGTVCGI